MVARAGVDQGRGDWQAGRDLREGLRLSVQRKPVGHQRPQLLVEGQAGAEDARAAGAASPAVEEAVAGRGAIAREALRGRRGLGQQGGLVVALRARWTAAKGLKHCHRCGCGTRVHGLGCGGLGDLPEALGEAAEGLSLALGMRLLGR
eukprot:scaffold489952_cov39-Prasinocladus_malaysianus.AAC.1